MTAAADNPNLPPDGDEASSAAAPTAPKKRARKAAAPAATAADVSPDESASGSAVASEPAPAVVADEPAAKPARKRRAPAKAAADEQGTDTGTGDAPVVAMSSQAELPLSAAAATLETSQAPARAGRSDRPQRGNPVEEGTQEASSNDEGSSEGGQDADGRTADGQDGDGTSGEFQERGELSRRRGRKNRNRGEGGEPSGANAGAPGTDQAATPNAPREQRPASPAREPSAPLPEALELFAKVMSGEFDVEGEASSDPAGPAAAEALGGPLIEQPVAAVLSEEDDEESSDDTGEGDETTGKRVLEADVDAPKLQKVLAQAGIGSRRDMEDLIVDGRITVNGEPAHIGQRISFGDRVHVNGKQIKFRIQPPTARIIAYHKPIGEVVTHDDPQHRPTVFRRLPKLPHGKWQSVGRLDINTEGLLLFTNHGELANQLMHPRFGVEREYAARVLGTLDAATKARLLEGVKVDGQTASFQSIEDGGGEGANHWYRVVITEGRNREVRKLFDAVGMAVSRLIRIRYGTVVLPRGLKRGVWVDLSEDDVKAIRQLAGAGNGAERGPRQGQGQGQAQGQQNGQGNARNDGRNGKQRPNDRGPVRQQQPQQPQQQRGAARPNDRGPQQGRPNDRGPAPQDRGPAPANRNARKGPPDRPVDRDGPRIADYDDGADFDRDFEIGPIPNPLEQTFDKRFVQRPRTPAGGAGFGRGGGGFGAGGSAPPPGPKKGSGPAQPDPMQTSLGYIGGDAFFRKGKGGGGGGGGGGGNRGGNRGGGGGFGGGGGGGGGGFGGGGGGGRRGR